MPRKPSGPFLLIALGSVALLTVAACAGGGLSVPSPSATPSIPQRATVGLETATPAPAPNQLTYIDAAGNIVLVNADGSDARKLADASACGDFARLVWSPTGQRLACIGGGANGEGPIVLMNAEGETAKVLSVPAGVWDLHWSPREDAFLYYSYGQLLFVADDSGRTLAQLGPVDLPLSAARPYRGLRSWSPDGREFVYRPADAPEMRVYSLDSHSERSLPGDYRPLAWALGGKALLVAIGGYSTYEVNLLDLASGEVTRVPELDNGRQFWLAPDGRQAVVLTRGTAGTDGYPGLAMLALPSGEFNSIPDSVITYGSDHIPEEWVTFTPGGSQIYWITQWQSGAAVFRANSDGTGLTKMTQVGSPGAEFSPDLTMLAYYVFDENADTVTLCTSRIDGSSVHEIHRADTGGGGFGPAPAWRPTP
jgi:hypothetical protein